MIGVLVNYNYFLSRSILLRFQLLNTSSVLIHDLHMYMYRYMCTCRVDTFSHQTFVVYRCTCRYRYMYGHVMYRGSFVVILAKRKTI